MTTYILNLCRYISYLPIACFYFLKATCMLNFYYAIFVLFMKCFMYRGLCGNKSKLNVCIWMMKGEREVEGRGGHGEFNTALSDNHTVLCPGGCNIRRFSLNFKSQRKPSNNLTQGLILHFFTPRTQGPAKLVIHRSFNTEIYKFFNLNLIKIPKINRSTGPSQYKAELVLLEIHR